jgi:hypothetical protein
MPIAPWHGTAALSLADHARLDAELRSLIEQARGIADQFLAVGNQVQEIIVRIALTRNLDPRRGLD